MIAVFPILAYVRWAKTAENATDYSLQNTVQNALFLPTTREQKYKAKQVTDSFSKRFGDTLSALTVFVIVTFFLCPLQSHAQQALALINGCATGGPITDQQGVQGLIHVTPSSAQAHCV